LELHIFETTYINYVYAKNALNKYFWSTFHQYRKRSCLCNWCW